VFRTIFAFTRGRADVAEEAVAEAFARAVAHREGIQDPLPWIYRVAFRVAKEELRREGRRDRSDPTESISPPEITGVMQALRRLSANQRAAVVLRYVLDLDVREVARRMGVAAPTVRVHLFRARAKLREILGDEEGEWS
jgi:RNA polymerase sigma-70 factor (ECF subfamily)